jgi:MOSC domain-containing protein YiiM
LKENFGIIGDVHAGSTLRQVSILSLESIKKQNLCPKIKRKAFRIKPGDFGENITTEGLGLKELKLGDRLVIGEVLLEISAIGKKCHRYCAVYYKTGGCIMPSEGIFSRVIKGGIIKPGDVIDVQSSRSHCK